MEPIKVILVDQNDLIGQILASPIFSFVLGSIFTYAMAILTNKLGILGTKKEKVLLMKETFDELLDSVDRVVIFLDPNTHYPPDFIDLDVKYESKEEYEKAFQKQITLKIDLAFDELHSLKKVVRPMIAFYTSRKNATHLLNILEIVETINREFIPQSFVFKKVYVPEVLSRVMHRIRNEYTRKARQIIEAVLHAETGFFANKTVSRKLKKLRLASVKFSDFLANALAESEAYEKQRANHENPI